VVLEIPPADEGSITGAVMDVWQSALPATGYKDQVPAGYVPLASQTYEGYALLRSIPKSGNDADVAKRLPTASGSSSIRFHTRPIRRRRPSSTPSTSCMTAPSLTTCGSSSRSTVVNRVDVVQLLFGARPGRVAAAPLRDLALRATACRRCIVSFAMSAQGSPRSNGRRAIAETSPIEITKTNSNCVRTV
jgi:hypothetical protein